MKKWQTQHIIRTILLGKRYGILTSVGDQVRYMTMNAIFIVAMVPLVVLGISMKDTNIVRSIIDFTIASLCFISLILIRSKLPLHVVPLFPVTIFGGYCVFLFYLGDFGLWAAVWLFSFPLVVIFLCGMTIGVIESVAVLIACILIMYTPIANVSADNAILLRIFSAYTLILSLTIIYESISILKDKKEKVLNAELVYEKDVIQTMKDNIQQGVFLMDEEFKILPLYSKPLISILSYYDSELTGKNLLDILAASLDARQLQTMKGYFSMVFAKSKSAKVLESANPISEFEYKIDDRIKILSTRFHLVENPGAKPVVIGIVQDITKEKEFEKELESQREARQLEMKNMFDVIQIDPLVFQDFIEDTEANFNYINNILKDRSLTEKQVVTKLYQNVHAIKSNALILGLESLGKELHALEDDIKSTLDAATISVDDVLSLAIKLEAIMQEKDEYIKIVKKIESFKTSNRIDSVLINSLSKAVEKVSEETKKKVELKIGLMDLGILESSLRKPIKDILFQCIRNSIYHGIEPVEERIKKNKKPMGLLSLSIVNSGIKAEINFSDDGRGLDWDKIRAQYLKTNPGATDTGKNTLLKAIFSPEFSTSAETSMVAGRGVGLSLVKDIVKDNGGNISVHSTDAGLGFKFTFPSPL